MLKDVEEINNIMKPPLPFSTAVTLLNHLKWDKDNLFEKYLDDPDKLFKEAKISKPKTNEEKEKTNREKRLKYSDEMLCEICYLIQPRSLMTGLEECAHMYCKKCWNGYLTNKIMSEGVGSKIFCPETSCDALVDGLKVIDLIESQARKTYSLLVSNNFVNCHRLLKWCPAPNCTNAIKVDTVEAKPALCHCGHRFCFSCGENWHAPVTCKLLRKWMKKCQDDSETANWINANTKDCPKCQSTIEKNGGCNHMSCSKCAYEFCWICMKNWTNDESCNEYNEEEGVRKDESRAALEKYMFYYERYMNHFQSIKLESKIKEKVANAMKSMQNEANISWIEAQFLQNAFETLKECRRVLMHTYMFAFYVRKNNHLEIFEDNQKDLEIAVETLCSHLERADIYALETDEFKQKVQDKTKYCKDRKQVLIEHVEEGYTKQNMWVFNETGCLD